MQYMVQMLSKRDDWDAIMGALAEEDVQRLVRYNVELDEELRKRGELLEDRGLAGPQAVTTVQAVPGGEPRVTQGPYRPDEQFLVGYWVIEVDSMERGGGDRCSDLRVPWPGWRAREYPGGAARRAAASCVSACVQERVAPGAAGRRPGYGKGPPHAV
ncbi:YciI family protein [Streptomyces sp. CA-288835]|uniref:YciI family protein n=1 Tax=Streptomyces sp. CA-288835 TaxID=3240069 RepID=UPI003D8E6AB9